MEYTDGFTFQFGKTRKFLSEKLLTIKYDTLYNFCYSNKPKYFLCLNYCKLAVTLLLPSLNKISREEIITTITILLKVNMKSTENRCKILQWIKEFQWPVFLV